ncbi:MAG: hypothetical protein H8E51_06255 [Bacteroidetes bacterium]|nr:hypothetical protein [Bacteroidota bacterium]
MEKKDQSKIISLDQIGDEPVGGKARGLKLLQELKLSVPPGFVIIHPELAILDDQQFLSFMEQLGDSPKAVRSSAVSEDGHDASFAGQFESYLHISGMEEIKSAIQKCIETASSSRVHHYSQHRKADADLGISVIVQNMIPAQIAGVLFSADPVSHRRDKMIVNVVKGLGEELVSGRKDAHHYEINRNGSDIEELICSDDSLLTILQMKELINGAQLAETAFGQPVDMEWAINIDGKVNWLQARPITTLNEVHYNELDTVKGGSDDVWTLGNIGEMMPGVITPLTYSVVVDTIDYGMCVLAEKAGAFNLRKRKNYRYIQMFYNRLFINLTNMMDYPMHTWLNKPENIQLALSVEVNPDMQPERKVFILKRVVNFFRQSYTIIRAGKNLNRLTKMAAFLNVNTDLPRHELYEELGLARMTVCKGFGHHLITSGQSGSLYSAFMGILTGNKRLPNAEDHHLATILLTDIPDIESADAVKSLEALSIMIRSHSSFAELFINISPEEAIRKIQEEAPGEITRVFNDFLGRHGHRCVRESELREQPWEENQEHLIQLLQAKVKFGKIQHQEFDIKEETRKTLRKLPFYKRFIFRILLPSARKAVARREISKALVIKMVNELRKGYRMLADKMLDPGSLMLDDADQIYFLTYEEVGRLIETSDKELIKKANRRRELLPETDNLQFDEVCHGIPRPREDKYIPDLKQDQLYGTPVSSGKVKARARVINTIEDADLLEKGEIMVASFTDIGWTPYFSIISGLITEIGSPLSHGAVVAREYGIPAIVGAKGAKAFVCDGDFVLLDGDKGIIERMRNVKS